MAILISLQKELLRVIMKQLGFFLPTHKENRIPDCFQTASVHHRMDLEKDLMHLLLKCTKKIMPASLPQYNEAKTKKQG